MYYVRYISYVRNIYSYTSEKKRLERTQEIAEMLKKYTNKRGELDFTNYVLDLRDKPDSEK